MKALTLINPRSRRKKRKSTVKRRKMSALQRKYFGSKRTRATRRRRARRNPVLMRNARPRRRTAKRRTIRRRARRNPISLGGFLTQKFILMAAGAVATPFVNDAILNNSTVRGFNLPGIDNKWGNAIYRLLIPMGASAVLKKYGGSSVAPFAKGLALGGLINAISTMAGSIKVDVVLDEVLGTGQYFPALFANGGRSRGGRSRALAPVGGTPGYSASSAFSKVKGASGPFDGERAFPSDGWSGN